MKAVKYFILFSMCLGLLISFSIASPDDDSEVKSEGEVLLGSTFTDLTGYDGNVAEYDVANQGSPGLGWLPMVAAHATVWTKNMYLEMEAAHSGNASDQRYRLYFDASRIFKTTFTLNKFLHRLDHDPLYNIDASQGVVKVYIDDLSPGHKYRINYTDIRSNTEIRIPEADWLKFQVEYRRESRPGGHQGYQLNHCYACHIVTVNHPVDEVSNSIRGSVVVDTGDFGVSYSYFYKETNQGDPALMFPFDPGLNPGSLVDMFTSRTLYDQRDGILPGNMLTESKKTSHTGKAHYNFNDRTTLAGAIVLSEVENEYTKLKTHARYYTGRFSTLFKRDIAVTARLRFSNIDTHTTFVELQERPNVAGPQVGATYTQAYPDFGSVSFTRFSANSRENTDLDLSVKIPLDRHRLSFLYNYRDIDRDYYEVPKTEKHRITVSFRTDPKQDLTGQFRYRAEFVSNPFVNLQAAIAPALQPTPSPGGSLFAGTQYFQIYGARQATLSNLPTGSHDLNLMGTWKPADDLGVNFNYNYRNQKNDDLNFSDWSQHTHNVGANVWYTPEERVILTAGINYDKYETETLFTQPVWNG